MTAKINYDQAAATYDHTRDAGSRVVDRFKAKIDLSAATRVLDFGCGTGNYIAAIRAACGAQCWGLEPSDGMRAIAAAKNPDCPIAAGDHANMPFPDDFFDFAYLTDVIHHVPDLSALFRNLRRVLKPGGYVAVLTESHAQVANRWFNRYFPSLEKIELQRYPDVDTIAAAAAAAGWSDAGNEILPSTPRVVVSDSFIRLAEEKGYSMFRLLPDDEYRAGLERLRADRGKSFNSGGHGETILWFKA